jgi:hypothetical protein
LSDFSLHWDSPADIPGFCIYIHAPGCGAKRKKGIIYMNVYHVEREYPTTFSIIRKAVLSVQSADT